MKPFTPATHRKCFIDKKIRENTYPTASSLARDYAAEFGSTVDPRTIANDIADMRYKLNAPIRYDSENKGYIYTDPAFTADILQDTPDIPLTGLGLGGLAAMGVIGGFAGKMPNSSFLSDWQQKLITTLSERLIPHSDTTDIPSGKKPFLGKVSVIVDAKTTGGDSQTEDTVKNALEHNKEIAIDYEEKNGSTYHCRLNPLHLVYIKNISFVFGMIETNTEISYALFSLHRIRKAEPTGSVFQPPRYINIQTIGRGIEAMFSSDSADTILVFAAPDMDDADAEFTLLSKLEIYAKVKKPEE
jgi:predicted DNA-binding transcriptional regulator YafY